MNNASYKEWKKLLEKSVPHHLLKNTMGLINHNKEEWLSLYCYYHSLNENKLNEMYTGYITPSNLIGMGSPQAPATFGGTSQFHKGTQGSGDLFTNILGLAVNIALKTVGFDIVPVIPMPSPIGVLRYLDYVYGGGTLTGVKPYIFKIDAPTSANVSYTKGNVYWGCNKLYTDLGQNEIGYAVKLVYVGKSRLDGYPIFNVVKSYTMTYDGTDLTMTENNNIALSDVFIGDVNSGTVAYITLDSSNKPDVAKYVQVVNRPQYVQALVDHITGYTGAGYDNNLNFGTDWDGNVYGMGRGAGERGTGRPLSIRTFTKFVEALTHKVTIGITVEQMQDLRLWGLDANQLMQEILVNEVSQSINKDILSRAFALGWQNHIDAYKSMGVNLNLNADPTATTSSTTPAFTNKYNNDESMVLPPFQKYGDFENLNTIQARVMMKVMSASNVIQQRGRLGGANFIVTNTQIASVLQSIRGFTFAPVQNNISQDANDLYALGTLAGMTIYVDPYMPWNDTRILVGRKGKDESVGLKFMPYLMAESVQAIVEGTMAPKVMVISRYALAEAGFYPETQYLTLYVNTGSNPLV